MTKFFDEINKLGDIFNLGRMVFYTAAGVLPMIPVFMLIELAGQEPSAVRIGFLEQLSQDLKAAMSHWPAFISFSIIMGFMIAIVSFATVLERENERATRSASNITIKEYGITYRYPLLINNEKADYQSFLISEYYRFVEISVFVPIGMLLATTFFLPYPILYLLLDVQRSDGVVLNGGHLALPISAALSALMWYHVWPRFWVPIVVRPALEGYQYHKRSLICGVIRHKNETGESALHKPRTS